MLLFLFEFLLFLCVHACMLASTEKKLFLSLVKYRKNRVKPFFKKKKHVLLCLFIRWWMSLAWSSLLVPKRHVLDAWLCSAIAFWAFGGEWILPSDFYSKGERREKRECSCIFPEQRRGKDEKKMYWCFFLARNFMQFQYLHKNVWLCTCCMNGEDECTK